MSGLPVIDVTTDLTGLGYAANAVADVAGGGDAIQDAIDHFIDNPGDFYAVYVPEGLYMTTKPLIVTSSTFCNVVMTSTIRQFPGGGDWPKSLGGARIELHDDIGADVQTSWVAAWLPVLIVQGGRSCVFQGISFVNTGNTKPSENWDTDGIGSVFKNPAFDDWVTQGARTNRYSPCCAVAVDPFMDEYPAGDPSNCYHRHESYYGGSSLPTPRASSGTTFIGCHFQGGVVGVAMSPPGPGTDDDDNLQNNDNTEFVDCFFYYNTIHFSSGQSQERGTNMKSPRMQGSWIAMDDQYVGPGGTPGVPPHLTGAPEISGTRYIFNINAGHDVQMSNIYAEATASIGKLGYNVNTGRNTTLLSGCNFTLASAAEKAPNEPEVEYRLHAWHGVVLDCCTFSVGSGGIFSVDNHGHHGRLWFRACKLDADSLNDRVPLGLAEDGVHTVLEHFATRNSGAPYKEVFNTNPAVSPGFTTHVFDSGNNVTVVQDATDKGKGVVTVAAPTDLEVGMIVRTTDASPNHFTSQPLTPALGVPASAQQTYASHGPIGRITAVTPVAGNMVEVTITAMPYGFDFTLSYKLEGVSWDNSGGND